MSNEVDLRNLPFIPLHIGRLQRSKAWLACKREPALAFYMLNLWMRAWHEVPCGSIDDDDDVLADAAMCPPGVWNKVREKVLRGWESRDGRVYNPTVAEIGQTSWTSKQTQRQRTEAARQSRLQRRDSSVTGSVTENVTQSVTQSVTEDVTASNITQHNITQHNITEGKGKNPPKPPRGLDGDPEFDAFWQMYPNKVGKDAARKAWVNALKRATAAEVTGGLAKHKFNPDPKFHPHPSTWLNQGRWADETSSHHEQADKYAWLNDPFDEGRDDPQAHFTGITIDP